MDAVALATLAEAWASPANLLNMPVSLRVASTGRCSPSAALTPLTFLWQAFTPMELRSELDGLRVGALGGDTSLCRSPLR